MKNVIKYIDDMKATEERFIDDINSLIASNRAYLNKKSLSFQTRQEQINTLAQSQKKTDFIPKLEV